MKYLPAISLFIYAVSAHAQVYKCTNASGKIYYQAEQCPSGKQQEQLKIIKTDKQKIAEAQAESAKRIAAWKEQEKLKQEQAEQAQAALQEAQQQNQQQIQPYVIDEVTMQKLISNRGRSRGLYNRQSDLLPQQ